MLCLACKELQARPNLAVAEYIPFSPFHRFKKLRHAGSGCWPACLPVLCTALPNPAEGRLNRVSMWLSEGSFAAMWASVEKEGDALIRRVPSPESQAFGFRILLDLSLTPTPGALLLFHFLKAPCHERHQLTLNKPALCRLPRPGPLIRGPHGPVCV